MNPDCWIVTIGARGIGFVERGNDVEGAVRAGEARLAGADVVFRAAAGVRAVVQAFLLGTCRASVAGKARARGARRAAEAVVVAVLKTGTAQEALGRRFCGVKRVGGDFKAGQDVEERGDSKSGLFITLHRKTDNSLRKARCRSLEKGYSPDLNIFEARKDYLADAGTRRR